MPATLPSLPGVPPVVPPVVPTTDPTALIPAPLAANIQRFFFAGPGRRGAGARLPPAGRRSRVQGESTSFPRVKADAAGTGPVGP